jgi:hypothetical protein
MRFRAAFVDALPSLLWKSGNLYMPFNHRPFSDLPKGTSLSTALHFCVCDGVRTVEWDGQEIAEGSSPFVSPDW